MYCKHQQGFSLPVAIFILVIMALIGTAAVSLMQRSMEGVGNEVMSTRAFFAAESGAQYAMNQLFSLTGAAANCPATYPVQNYNSTGIASCTATVQCSGVTVGSKTYYTVTSTGNCSTGDINATRQIQLMAVTP